LAAQDQLNWLERGVVGVEKRSLNESAAPAENAQAEYLPSGDEKEEAVEKSSDGSRRMNEREKRRGARKGSKNRPRQ